MGCQSISLSRQGRPRTTGFVRCYAPTKRCYSRIRRGLEQGTCPATKSMGEHPTETKSQDPICFRSYLYRASNLVERFFTRSSNVGVSRPDTTDSRPTTWPSSSRLTNPPLERAQGQVPQPSRAQTRPLHRVVRMKRKVF